MLSEVPTKLRLDVLGLKEKEKLRKTFVRQVEKIVYSQNEILGTQKDARDDSEQEKWLHYILGGKL